MIVVVGTRFGAELQVGDRIVLDTEPVTIQWTLEGLTRRWTRRAWLSDGSEILLEANREYELALDRVCDEPDDRDADDQLHCRREVER